MDRILRQRWLTPLALIGCAVLIVCFRLHGLDLALDSDEGDYAHVAQRLLAGERSYLDVWDNKPPTVHWTFALALWLFGDSDHSIRWLGMIFSLATLAAVYACARQLMPAGAALWVAFLFCFLNVEPRSHSHITKSELFLSPFLFTALAAALRYLATRRLPWLAVAGLCVGVALSYKPWFLLHVPLLMALAWRGGEGEAAAWPARLKRWALVVGVAAVPGLICLAWIFARGTFEAAWDAMVVFNRYVTRVESRHPNPLWNWVLNWVELFWSDAWRGWLLPVWYAGVASAAGLLAARQRPGWRLLGAWTLLVLMEVTSGPRLSTYYFGPILPLVVMAIVCACQWMAAGRRVVRWLINATMFALIFVQVWTRYLGLDNRGIMMAMWDHDVYKSFRQLGFELHRIMPPGERIYMWGFDTINFYSQRPSGSRYHFVCPSEFDERRTHQLVEDVLRNRPMMFYENHAFPPMPPRLKQFLIENYEPVLHAGLFTLNVLKEKRALWENGLRRAQGPP